MARTFITSFDTANEKAEPPLPGNTAYQGLAAQYGGAWMDTSGNHTGSLGLRPNPSSGNTCYWDCGIIDTGVARWYRFYFKPRGPDGLPTATRTMWGNAATLGLKWTSTGAVELWRGGSSIGTSTYKCDTYGQWYCIEIKNSATERILRIDGVDRVTDTATITIPTVYYYLGCNDTATGTWHAFFDDFSVDDSEWCGEGKIGLAIPISDNARATLWTGGAGGTTNLYDAVNNLPPIGTASETNLTQIEHAGGASGTTDAYDANLTTYATLGMNDGDTVKAIMPFMYYGEDATTGAKQLSFQMASNPSGSSTGAFDVAPGNIAVGTWPTGWTIRTAAMITNPSVTRTSSPVMRVVRPETANRVASVCLMAAYIEWKPAIVLTIQNAAQTQTAPNVGTVSPGTPLTIQNVAQAESVASPALGQQYTLVTSAIAETQTVQNVLFVIDKTLAITNASQAQSVGNLTLSQAGPASLEVQNPAQSQTSPNVYITVNRELALQTADQEQSAQSQGLVQQHVLVITDLAQSQSAANVGMTRQGPIAINIYPTAYNSQSGTTWITTTVGNVDEDASNPDGAYIQSGVNATGYVLYDMTNMPSAFAKMVSMKFYVRYNLISRNNDNEYLYIQVVKSDGVTALTDDMLVAANPNTGWNNSGWSGMTGVLATGTKADWDGALIKIRTVHDAVQSADNSYWEIDLVNLLGIYQSAPQLTINYPSNGATVGHKPSISLTGSDEDNDDLEYQIQIDLANTFDSGHRMVAQAISYAAAQYAIYGGSGTNQAVAQSFTPTINMKLSYITYAAYKTGTPTDYYHVYLRSGSQGGTTVKSWLNRYPSNTYPVPDIYTLDALDVTLTANTTYYLVFERSGSRDTVNYFNISNDTSNSIPEGTASINNSGSWNDQSVDLYILMGGTGVMYELSSSLDDGFSSSPDTTSPFASGQEVIYSDLQFPGGVTLYWRARVRDPNGMNVWQNWSTTRSFTTQNQFILEIHDAGQAQSAANVSLGRDGNLLDVCNATTSQAIENIELSEKSPTVSPVSPSNGGTVDLLRPVLRFVGTDANKNDIAYEIQIDQASSFENTPFVVDTFDGHEDTAYVINSSTKRAGQSFIPSTTGKLINATFMMTRDGDPTAKACLYSHSGSYGSSSVGNSLLATSEIITDFTWIEETGWGSVTFEFTDGYELQANTQYVIVVQGVNCDSNNTVAPWCDTAGSHGGNYCYYSGSSWSYNAAYDASFAVRIGVAELDKLSSSDSGFTGSPDNSSPFTSGQEVQYTFQASLVNDTTYYWRVRGKDPSGSNSWGAWSTIQSFHIDASGVFLLSPANNEVVYSTPALQFKGYADSDNLVQYELQLDTSPSFDSNADDAREVEDYTYVSGSTININANGNGTAGVFYCGKTGYLKKVAFRTTKTGNAPNATITAKLFIAAGENTTGYRIAPAGTALTSSTAVTWANIVNGGWTFLSFDETYLLTEGTRYAIALFIDGTEINSSNYIAVSSGDAAFFRPYNGSGYNAAGDRWYFYTYSANGWTYASQPNVMVCMSPGPKLHGVFAFYEFWTLSGGSDTISPWVSGESKTYTPSTLSLGTYYWRVRATNSANDVNYAFVMGDVKAPFRPWSPTYSFTIEATTVLTIQNASQAQSVQKPSLGQVHILSIQNAAQTQTIESATPTIPLSINDLAQSQAIENVPVILLKELVIQELAQTQLIQNVGIVLPNVTAGDPSLQLQSVDNIVLTQIHLLVLQDIIHPQAIDNVENTISSGRIYGPALQSV